MEEVMDKWKILGIDKTKDKEIIKEASDEIERREPKPLMPPSEIHY